MIRPDSMQGELTGGWIVVAEVCDDGSLKLTAKHTKGADIFPITDPDTGSPEWSINLKITEDKWIEGARVPKSRTKRKAR